MQIDPAVDIQQGRVACGIPGSGSPDPAWCAPGFAADRHCANAADEAVRAIGLDGVPAPVGGHLRTADAVGARREARLRLGERLAWAR